MVTLIQFGAMRIGLGLSFPFCQLSMDGFADQCGSAVARLILRANVVKWIDGHCGAQEFNVMAST